MHIKFIHYANHSLQTAKDNLKIIPSNQILQHEKAI